MTLTHRHFLARQERRAVSLVHHLVASWYLRKPDLRELLEIKFPDLATIGRAGLNELAYRLRTPRTARVLSLNVETTNHCNLRCTICPVNRDMVREKRFLDPAVFRRLVDRTPGLRFVLPFQWGEPLLHPEIHTMVRYARERGVRAMLTTNGTLLGDTVIDRLLRCGLDRLTVSVDGDETTHERIRGVPLALVRERVKALRRERDRRAAPLRIDVSMVLDGSTRMAIERYRASWRDLADRVQVIPRLQATAPRHTPCRELWRGSLVVLVDGTVTACCVDSEGRLALGNVHEKDPPAILNDRPSRELRRAHRQGRFCGPCAHCGEYDGQDVGVSARFQ